MKKKKKIRLPCQTLLTKKTIFKDNEYVVSVENLKLVAKAQLILPVLQPCSENLEGLLLQNLISKCSSTTVYENLPDKIQKTENLFCYILQVIE